MVSPCFMPPPLLYANCYRSNQSKSLALDESAICRALEIHDSIFSRSHEILGHISTERVLFSKFSGWVVLMAQDILAHEDGDALPLHTVDAIRVTEYITEYLPHQILAKFARDLDINATDTTIGVDNLAEDGYLDLVV